MKILVVDSEENAASKLTLHWLGVILPETDAVFLNLKESDEKKNPHLTLAEFDWVFNISSLSTEELKQHGIESPNIVNYSFKELMEKEQDKDKLSLEINHIVFFLSQKIFSSKDFLCSNTDCKAGNEACCSQCTKTYCSKKQKQ